MLDLSVPSLLSDLSVLSVMCVLVVLMTMMTVMTMMLCQNNRKSFETDENSQGVLSQKK